MRLLASDSLHTILQAGSSRRSYMPFGAALPWGSGNSGLHGQLNEPNLHGYLLGHGYRHYLPTLMRFAKSDSLSPFAAGGLNSYAFCMGEPVNQQDISGAAPLPKLLRLFKKTPKFDTQFPVTIRNASNGRTLVVADEANAKLIFKTTMKFSADAWTDVDSLRTGNNFLQLTDRAFRKQEMLKDLSKDLRVSRTYYERRARKVNHLFPEWPGPWREPGPMVNHRRAVPNEYR
ncbi:RHS repeat-associated core domain-containing protein [Pseudomonas sp. DC3000-4b1]|uniref:RHS repeat-associated core domain-containing protein n=1 Tax=unclassified Pseudomonas TaxID=196821 RepID=UPI003CEC3AE2